MATDWASLAKQLIPAGAEIVGGALANRAERGGINLSAEQLQQAYNQAQQALTGSTNQANALAGWGYGEQQRQLNKGFGQALAPATFGYNQARQDIYGGLQGALGAYGNASQILQPYANSGANALAQSNFLLYGQQPPMASGAPGRPMVPPPPSQVNPNMLGGGAPVTGGGAGQAIQGAPMPSTAVGGYNALGGGAGSFAPHLQDNRLAGPGIASAIAGPAIGIGGGALLGGGIGGLGGLGLGAVAGPIGMAAGLAGGLLINRLQRHNREKRAASDAVNEFSDWVWKDVMPAARSGQIPADQLKSTIESGWNDYTNFLNQNLHDKGVVANSINSQRQYLDQGLNGPNGYASIPGSGGAKPAAGITVAAPTQQQRYY